MTINLAGDSASRRLDLASALRRAAAAGIRAEVQHRKYSLKDLTALNDAIPRLEPFLSLGQNLLSWGVNPQTNTVRVGVASVTPDLADQVRAAFGDRVTLEKGFRSTPTAGRFTNLPNYLGGNRLRVGDRSCTGGFTIQNATGHRYALTAGHCFGVGDEVVVDRYDHFFGTLQYRRYHDSARMDMGLVGVDVYRGGIWTGPVEGDLPSNPVHSAGNSCTGCQVYFDGSFTGQALGTIISAGDSEDCLKSKDGGLSCHVVTVQGVNGAALCDYGDSGGPVFAYDGAGGVTAVGIITAGALNDDNTLNRNVCFYTRIVPILWYWQSTIYTVY